MATKLFFHPGIVDAETNLGTNNTKLDGATSGWDTFALNTTQGGSLASHITDTVTGPTSGVEVTALAGGLPTERLSQPVSGDVTIAGTITVNLYAFESDMAANVAINCIIEKIAAATGTLTEIGRSARTTELGTAVSVQSFTITPTSTVMNRGDRFRVRVYGDDSATTMAAGNTFTFQYGGAAAGDYDSYISFTETFTLEGSDPAGTTLYLTNTAAGIDPGSATEKEMWTSRGGGVQTAVTNTAAGWTTPIQCTDIAGGTNVEWYSKKLTAFTLGGKALLNLRGLESNAVANCQFAVEIAVCAADGTGAVTWGIARMLVAGGINAELATAQSARTVYVSGDDVSVAEGNRLRVRVFADDSNQLAMAAGYTMTLHYAGTSGGASGDSYLILPQTVSEYSAVRVPRSPGVDSGFGYL